MCIVQSPKELERIRRMLRQAPLVALRERLTDRLILAACRECGHRFRERRYGPVVTVLHFLAQALQREESFAATWQDLWTPLAAACPELDLARPDPSGLTHARARLPRAVMERLAADMCEQSDETVSKRWRGYRLRALDTATVSMPRGAALFEHFGTHRARSTTVRYPLGTVAMLLNLDPCLIRAYRFGPFDPGEDHTARPLLSYLEPGDLLLADRGFSGTPTYARIRARGADFLMRKNARLVVSKLPVIRRLGRNDFITELPMDKPARKRDPSLPKNVRVRVFKARWTTPAGERLTEWFVTSLEDASRFKKRTLAKLYHERWRIETTYLEFKQMLHADVLRSKTVDNIYKELAAHILAYQLVRLVICDAARKHHQRPTQISFLNAARWILAFSRRMAAAATLRLPFLYDRLLDAVASTPVDVRPGRLEPRAIMREPKHYPRLRTSRTEWRQQRLGRAS
ncbi:MAG: IS4 family transposase [Planctomycetota bacterium]